VPVCGGVVGAAGFGGGVDVVDVVDRAGFGVVLAVLREGGVAVVTGLVDGAAEVVGDDAAVVGAVAVDSRVAAGVEMEVGEPSPRTTGGGAALHATTPEATAAAASASAPSRAPGTDMAAEPTAWLRTTPPDVVRCT
jgi:hypothetical protein